MIYPSNIEIKIGFDRIKSRISEYCLSPMGEDKVNALKYLTDYTEISLQLKRNQEFKDILMMNESFPSSNYFDLREVLERLAIDGTTINKEELFDLAGGLRTVVDINLFFNESRSIKYPLLASMALLVQFPEYIVTISESIIDERGEIRDNATDKLSAIRRELRKLLGTSRDKLYNLLATAKKNGWTREDAEVTVRNGRVVIPLLASYKRSIKGFIHDESATGQTSYIEPIELFENNNRIKELEIEEDQEIKRILFEFAETIRPDLDSLVNAFEFLGTIDFIRAKARFALYENANMPAFLDETIINWKDAVHPLLAISHREKNKPIVSQNISLDLENRVLIISGPNAGGKSVMLKTIALNQYMLQCGLPITINPSSEAGIFENIFIDIGDEQSIDNDLSTYSSHLSNIKVFIEKSDKNTLILIDEFGSGTEPDLGGAIAAAALETFYEKGAFAVVTTHYADLKLLADRFSAMVNGAMMFDTNNLTPLYKFKAGNPGSSFAFEIAKSIGLNDSVLAKAASIVGSEKLSFDFQLQDLENERELLKIRRLEFENADTILAEMIEKYNEKLSQIKVKEKNVLHNARQEAKAIIDGANKAIENAINSIKSSGGDKVQSARVRKKIEATKTQIKEELSKDVSELQKLKPEIDKTKNSDFGFKVLDGIPKVNDYVIVKGQTTIGVIDSLKKETAVVDFNSIKMIVKLDTLQKVVPPKNKKPRHGTGISSVMNDIHERAAAFSPNIDIRGKRAEEALSIIENWIDEAVLTSNKHLEVLHGKGDGILRMILREMLQKNSSVLEFRDAPLELGGSGKTLIKLH